MSEFGFEGLKVCLLLIGLLVVDMFKPTSPINSESLTRDWLAAFGGFWMRDEMLKLGLKCPEEDEEDDEDEEEDEDEEDDVGGW